MNRLRRVLITLATVSACVLCPRAHVGAQTPEPTAQESQPTPEGVVDAASGKARAVFEGLSFLKEEDVRGRLNNYNVGVDGTFDYDPRRIRDAAESLKKMYVERGFLDASVEVREETWARPRLLTFVVNEDERRFLEELRFEGNRRVSSERLFEAARACLTDEGGDWRDDYNEFRVDWCMTIATHEMMAADGYLEGGANDFRVEKVGRGLRATVRVNEGLRYRWGDVKIVGANVFSPEQVAEMTGARRGAVADIMKVARVLVYVLEREYQDRGYAKVDSDVDRSEKPSARRPGDGVSDLKITIKEGPRFTVSSVGFEGNRLKTEDELKGALSLGAGEVFSRRGLVEGLERLYGMGVFDEFPRGTFDDGWKGVEFVYDDDKALVAIRIAVDESNLRAGRPADPR